MQAPDYPNSGRLIDALVPRHVTTETGPGKSHMGIWFDVTDIAEWRGQHTGIQRVVGALATRFELAGAAALFAHREFPRAVVRSTLLKTERTQAPAEADNPTGRGLRKQLRTVSLMIPRRFSPSHQSLARRIVRVMFDAESFAGRLQRSMRSAAGGERVGFAACDTVLIAGSAWEHPRFQTWLTKQKRLRSLRLCYFIYDLIPILEPQTVAPGLPERYERYLRLVCGASDLLFLDSESTRRDLVAFARHNSIRLPETAVIRLGDDISGEGVGDSGAIIDAPFLLSVGTIEGRKNQVLLYQMYKLAREQHVDLPILVIAGRPGWLSTDLLYALSHDPEVAPKIVILERATDDDLSWLYRHCLVTLYPSIYEGWGLPLSESLQHGKVCISSHAAAMREVGGDLIEYVSPYDAQALLRAVVKYLNHDTRRAAEDEIRERYKPASWDDTFHQIHDALAALTLSTRKDPN